MNSKSAQTQGNFHGLLTAKKQGVSAGGLARITAIGILALAVCLLVRPALASLDNPVTRPLLVIEGHITITVNPATGAYSFTDWGWATHTGLYSNSGSAGPGGLNLATGEFVSGSGVVVAANGDTINWVVGATPNTVVDISGTGEFQGVTGGFAVTVTSETLLSTNPDGTVTLAVTYTGKGTITY